MNLHLIPIDWLAIAISLALLVAFSGFTVWLAYWKGFDRGFNRGYHQGLRFSMRKLDERV